MNCANPKRCGAKRCGSSCANWTARHMVGSDFVALHKVDPRRVCQSIIADLVARDLVLCR